MYPFVIIFIGFIAISLIAGVAIWVQMSRVSKARAAHRLANPSSWSKVLKRLPRGTIFDYMGVMMVTVEAHDEIGGDDSECWEPGYLSADYRDSQGVIRTQVFAMNRAADLLAAPLGQPSVSA